MKNLLAVSFLAILTAACTPAVERPDALRDKAESTVSFEAPGNYQDVHKQLFDRAFNCMEKQQVEVHGRIYPYMQQGEIVAGINNYLYRDFMMLIETMPDGHDQSKVNIYARSEHWAHYADALKEWLVNGYDDCVYPPGVSMEF